MLLKNIALIPKNENTKKIQSVLEKIYPNSKVKVLSLEEILKKNERNFDIVLFDIDNIQKSQLLENLDKFKKINHFPTVCLISDFINTSITKVDFGKETDFIIKPFADDEIIRLLDLIYLKHKYDKKLYNNIQLDLLIETLQEGIAVVDEKENIIFANSAVAKIFDLDKDEIIGKNISNLVSQETFANILYQTNFRKQGITSSYELEVIKENGDKKFLQINATPRFLNNKYIGALATIIDITSQKEFEKELKEKNLYLENLLNVAKKLTSSLELNVVLEQIGNGAKELLKSDSFGIFFIKRKYVEPIISMPKDFLPEEKILLNECAIVPIIKNKKVVFINKNNKNLKFNKINFKNTNLIIAPFVIDNKAIGGMILTRNKNPYSDNELFVADTFATYASTTIKNAQVFEKLQKEIKSRRQAKRKLEKTQLRLSSIIKNVPNIVLYEVSKNSVYVTDNFKSLTGYDKELLINDQNFLYQHIHPEDKEFVRLKVKQWLQNPKEDLTVWFRFQKPNGKYIWLEDRKTYITSKKGSNLITGVLIDNSSLKEAEEALRQSEARYRAVVEDQTEFVNRFTPDGTFIFVNNTYCNYLGKSFDELIGKNWIEMYPKEKQEIVRNRLKALTPNNPVGTYEYEKMLPSGEIRWEEWTYRAIFDRDGKVKEIQSVGKDITERKKAEQLLLKERNRAEFFTDLMSHDINNLNHGIFSYLNIILRDENLPEQTKIRLKTCLHLSEEISNLIDKVRLLSDIDDISLELKPINITKLMENVIKTVSINSPRKIVMIDYDFKNKDIIVKANELLETVIYNILNNAIKHNDKKDVKINITHMYSKYTRFYRFEFHDNGPGIEDEMKGKIFNRMVRAGNDKRVHGFGLGLTLVKNIIEKFGGKIWVEDNVFGDPSQGSNFVVLLQAI